MKEIKRLSKSYPNFYCVELPKFHTKQVLEVKNGQCVLFNGSFNVLSFDNVSIGKKVSREEMALVHHQIAIAKHQEYIETFAKIYENDILNALRNSEPKEVAKIKCDRIDYLHQISENKDAFIDFYTEYDEKSLLAKNSVWYDEYDSLQEKMKQTIENGSINMNDYKAIMASYSSLIKDSVSLTVNTEVVRSLEDAVTNLDGLSKIKDNPKKKDKSIEFSLSGSVSDMAKTILKNTEFENEYDVTRYVAALNYLYSKREFKNISEGRKFLRKILDNSSAFSYVSVFEYKENNTGSNFNVTIGIGGYSFIFFSIMQKNMEEKIEQLKKPRGRIRLQYVNKDDIEEILKTILNK